MNVERYKQVERLFHEALAHPADQRDSFVDRSCGEDEELRSEVTSLLASDLKARNFIEEPPGEIAAALMLMQSSLLGSMLGHYQIQSKLGVGGMGEVYLAADTKLRRNVAIKVLPPESVGDERAKKRLVREAQAAAKLDHPNICAIHEVGEDQGHCFIVMQYIDGQTLAERIGDCPLPIGSAVDLAIQVADALDGAHSRGITHRDIKPQNIMVTSRDQAKVMDFGLARLAEEHAAIGSESETVSFVTEPGTIAGTIPYMSPEQVKGAAIDRRSDLFSFGAVLYEIVTGTSPFERGSAAETISAILAEDPRPLAEFAHGVPEELQRIVSKCLAKDREERYSSTSDLLSDLRRLKTSLDSGAAVSRDGTNRRNLRKWIPAAAFVVLIALASATYYLLFGKSEPAHAGINSLAILPFVNANDDPAAEYLSDGITESLINSLAQLSGLKVIARTTAFRYKGKDTDPQALGRDLRVDAVITGRVSKQGDNLIVQADLLNTADGSQVWGDRYSRKISDVFAVEEQIAKEIATNLRFKLSVKETRALAKRYTENVKAYQDYSIGWTYLRRRTGSDFFTAISYFEKAISEEPNYALAHAALTEAYASVTIQGLIEPLEGRHKMEESARKAFALDPNLPEAQVAIAQLSLYFPPYNFSAGEQQVRNAIELNPSMSQAYLVLGAALLEQGRLDEALEVWSKGREVDPLSAIIARLQAYTYLQKRDYARALELLRQSRALAPPFIIWSEAEVYTVNGKLEEVLAELAKVELEREDDPYVIYAQGITAAAQGSRSDALKMIKRLEQMSGLHRQGTLLIAMLHCALNEKESALALLERGLEGGAITIFYKNDPVWDPIRNEPRFDNLIQRMAIPKLTIRIGPQHNRIRNEWRAWARLLPPTF